PGLFYFTEYAAQSLDPTSLQTKRPLARAALRTRFHRKTSTICANIKNGTDLIPQDQAAFISQTPPYRRKPRESSFGPKSAFRLKNARRPRARLEHGAFGSSQNLN
ncbi:hypothetical protein, partial [Slackia isoflavoniconvertens]|uniref:hypothetical protein n=1 Tax=Slackia isoflavoniconvertens TaxID=572010 RepID=UPI003A940E2D